MPSLCNLAAVCGPMPASEVTGDAADDRGGIGLLAEPKPQWYSLRSCMMPSISTATPFGNAATPTAARAG